MAKSGKLYLYSDEESKLIELLLAASKISSLETKDNHQYMTFSFPEASPEARFFPLHCDHYYKVKMNETNSSLQKDFVAPAASLSLLAQNTKLPTPRFLSEEEITDIAAKLHAALTKNDPKAIAAIPALNTIDQARVFHRDPSLLHRALKMDDPSCLLKLTSLFHRSFLEGSATKKVLDEKEENPSTNYQDTDSFFRLNGFHFVEAMSDKELVKFLFSARRRIAGNVELLESILLHLATKRPIDIYSAFLNAINTVKISNPLHFRDNHRRSLLHLAAARSSQNYFEDFIELHSDIALSEACKMITYDDESVLSIALEAKQQPDTTAKLLLKINDSAIDTMMGNNLSEELTRAFADTLAQTPSWQTSAFTAKFLPYLTNKMAVYLLNALKFSYAEIPATIKSFLFASLLNSSHNRWARTDIFEPFYFFSVTTQKIFNEFVRYISLESNRAQAQAIHYTADTLTSLFLAQKPEAIAALLKLLTPAQKVN